MSRILGATSVVVVLFGLAWAGPVAAKTLFYDNLDAAQLDKVWLLDYKQQEAGAGPPEWVHENGVLSQKQPQPGDPTYAVIQGENWPDSYGIMAKVRLDEWQDHDRSRAGLGVWLDPADSYNGYTWLIHERLDNTNMEFLNDHRAWFQQEETFPVEVGKWYWMKVFIDADSGDIMGKIWEAKDSDHSGVGEPNDWLSVFPYGNFGAVRQPTSFAGLNGGSGTNGGDSTASFDDVFVFDADGPDPLAVDPMGKLPITWGTLKSR